MIGRLTGLLIEKTPPALVIDVQGVGYELDAPMSTIYELPELHSSVSLFTHLIVREDAHLLYGFVTREERTLFRALLKVNGVGAKVALAILSTMNVSEFFTCVVSKDVSALVRVPGIGKKTAERLLVEMQDKIDVSDAAPVSGPAGVQSPESNRQQAEEALAALGYKTAEVATLLDRFASEDQSVEQMIRAALRGAGR